MHKDDFHSFHPSNFFMAVKKKQCRTHVKNSVQFFFSKAERGLRSLEASV
jgi:hypothetical protein